MPTDNLTSNYLCILDVTSMLDAALTLAQKGFFVFPVYEVDDEGKCSCGRWNCTNQGKHPRSGNGHKDATKDEKQIRKWWETWPDANIGINCQASGVIVIDTDPRHGGDVSLAELETEHGTLPETLTALTGLQDGTRGMHRYFRAEPGDLSFKGSMGPGIDIKYNGFVVAAPSRHRSGVRYEWINGAADIAPLPEWVLKIIVDTKEKKSRETPIQRRGGTISDKLNLRVEDFLMPINPRERDGQMEGEHPVHGSDTGSNLVIDSAKNIWYCRRHGTGGGALEALAVADGIIQCEDSRPGCLEGKWAEVFQALEARGYDSFDKARAEADLNAVSDFVKALLARGKNRG